MKETSIISLDEAWRSIGDLLSLFFLPNSNVLIISTTHFDLIIDQGQ